MTRSRLRKPTSKSTTTTCSPRAPNPHQLLRWTLSCRRLLFRMHHHDLGHFQCSFGSVHCYDLELIPFEPGLYRRLAQMRLDFVGNDAVAIDGDQLGVQPAAKDFSPAGCRRRQPISPAQRSVDVNGTGGDDSRAGRHRPDDSHVAVRVNDRLAGTHRGVDQKRADRRRLRRLNCRRRRCGGIGPLGLAAHQGRNPAVDIGRICSLDTENADVASAQFVQETEECRFGQGEAETSITTDLPAKKPGERASKTSTSEARPR